MPGAGPAAAVPRRAARRRDAAAAGAGARTPHAAQPAQLQRVHDGLPLTTFLPSIPITKRYATLQMPGEYVTKRLISIETCAVITIMTFVKQIYLIT